MDRLTVCQAARRQGAVLQGLAPEDEALPLRGRVGQGCCDGGLEVGDRGPAGLHFAFDQRLKKSRAE